MVRQGKIGRVHTVESQVWTGATVPQHKSTPVPAGWDYDQWLGPVQWRPFVQARVDHSRDEPGLKVADVLPIERARERFCKKVILRLTETDATEERLRALQDAMRDHGGETPVFLRIAQADGNQDCWFAKSLLPESVFNAAKPSTLTLKFPPLGKTAEATFSLHSEHPEVGAVIDSFDFVAKWVGKVGGPDLTNPASGLPTNPVENYADGYQYWPKLEKALGLNSPQVSCSNMTCSIKNLFSPLQNLYAVFEMTRSQ